MTPTTIDTRRWVIDLTAVALLLAVSVVGFWPTFAGGSYLVAAVGGSILGIGIAAVAAWRRWGMLVIAGLVVVAYFLFGGALALPHTAIAGIVPTGDTLTQLALGVVTSWKKLLTTVAPVAVTDGHALVPFILMLVAGVLTASLALRLRGAWWALIPATVLLITVIALGVADAALPLVQGILFAVVTTAWFAVRGIVSGSQDAVALRSEDPTQAAGMQSRRLISAAIVLAVAVGIGIATSSFTAPTTLRTIARDTIVPPFDIRDYPSPLQSFRKFVRDFKSDTLFTVEGLPADARVRIAAMDEFDGQVYNVTDGGAGTSSAFAPVRDNMSPNAEGAPATLKFTMDGYSGVWVPTVGAVSEIDFAGADADQLRRSGYYNNSTGTAVTTRGLASGDSYQITTTIPKTPTDEEIGDADFAKSTAMKPVADLPEDIATLAGETVADAETPVAQVRALATFLSEEGFFSHGLQGEVVSRAGHTTERIMALLGGQQMIGDDEQYAVTMALMARELGIPARVVFGFHLDEDAPAEKTFEANSDTVHAWVEVNFTGFGWVPFDPTPPEDQVPNDVTTKPKVDPKPQVLQPPPPPQEPVDLPPTVPDDRKAEDEKLNVAAILGVILLVGGITLGTLLLILSPFIIIGAWKAARRRARRAAERSADRISGGWDELTDRATDYGARISLGRTRSEQAVEVAESMPIDGVTALATDADAKVFGPHEPTPEEVDAFWAEVDELVGALGKENSFWKRTRARLSLRSLLQGSKLSRRWQGLRSAALVRTPQKRGNIDSNTSVPPESDVS